MAKLRQQDYLAYLRLLARLAVAAAFLLAALPKIQDPVAFAASVQGFHVVGGELAGWIALVLPWLELVVGFGLLIPQLRRGSGSLILLLLLLFIGLHASAWARGLDVSCGCFGENETAAAPNYFWLIARNIALLAACLWVLAKDRAQAVSAKR